MGSVLDGAIAVRVGAISARDGAVAGAAEGARIGGAAGAARGAARGAERGAREAATIAFEEYGRNIAELAAAEINELKREIATLKFSRLVDDARNRALIAQRNELKRLGSNSPSAFAPSGKLFADGKPKSILWLVYEAEFDRILIGHGITNPSVHRDN